MIFEIRSIGSAFVIPCLRWELRQAGPFDIHYFLASGMADVHDQLTRSYNMSRIRATDTKPEMVVRRFDMVNSDKRNSFLL